MEIMVKRLKKISNHLDKSIRGYCDVEVFFDSNLWFLIRDWRIKQDNEGALYAVPPFMQWSANGQRETANLVSMPARLRTQITTAILAEYSNGREENGEAKK